MRVTFYSAVVLVAAGSVVLGLDWMSAPMPPMPEAKNVVFAPPPPPLPPRVIAGPVAAPSPSPPVNPLPAAPVAVPAPVPVAPPRVVAAARPKCDVEACAKAYRSFQESDCTYNPSFGPRRLCTKGDPAKYANDAPTPAPTAPTAPPPTAEPAPAAPAAEIPGSIMAPEPGTAPTATPPRCNVTACAASYPRSFREADCTYNPGSGPRRVCEK